MVPSTVVKYSCKVAKLQSCPSTRVRFGPSPKTDLQGWEFCLGDTARSLTSFLLSCVTDSRTAGRRHTLIRSCVSVALSVYSNLPCRAGGSYWVGRRGRTLSPLLPSRSHALHTHTHGACGRACSRRWRTCGCLGLLKTFKSHSVTLRMEFAARESRMDLRACVARRPR